MWDSDYPTIFVQKKDKEISSVYKIMCPEAGF